MRNLSIRRGKAIERIRKKKAIGLDLISLIPLEGNKALKIKINNTTYEEKKE